ncbi:hypothetical protein OG765_00705 [Streptomyces sp. NBC_00555]|uniref:hypothetical protein n=1 Tax=Streptomyces sp. NBC_00555 TaxID=2903662 RepID=UPI00225861E2|nr:hypothetical protein [Streptomyces sp. NBC_00555]MCX5009524.1 hypothetical protein [Streptomyces sp. NBC_00555]
MSEALEYFYERAGALSLRRLQTLAGGSHLLPVSSAARIVNRQALPASRHQCAAFLAACGIGPRLVERWADAFDRIARARDIDPQTVSDMEAAAHTAAARRRWRCLTDLRLPKRFRALSEAGAEAGAGPGLVQEALFGWSVDQGSRAV